MEDTFEPNEEGLLQAEFRIYNGHTNLSERITRFEGFLIGHLAVSQSHPQSPLSDVEKEIVLHLRPLGLPLGKVLREPGSDDRLMYFVESGMASSTAISTEGISIEVGISGREGLAGISLLLGHPGLPHRTMMQGVGHRYSVPKDIAHTVFLRGGPMTLAVHDCIQGQLVQALQCASCNRVHGVEPRLARWIVTAADVMEIDGGFGSQLAGSDPYSSALRTM